MNTLRRDIDIAFSLASPEKVIECIKELRDLSFYSKKRTLSHKGMSKEYYDSLSRKIDRNYSYEEILNMHDEMVRLCGRYSSVPESLYQLLIKYGEEVLRLHEGIPVCRREKILNWRFVTLKHGQDLFTCAYLAYLSVTGKISYPTRFDWPAVIETDDGRLKSVLCSGIAENHFHLGGSTRVFTLSWIALMNYPEKINHFFNSLKKDDNSFTVNRNMIQSFSADENYLSWRDQLLYAAWLRARLFELAYGWSRGSLLTRFLQFENHFEKSSRLISEVKALQLSHARRFLTPDHVFAHLDYALCKESSFYDPDSSDRLMCGERELLYRLFLMSFRGELRDYEKDLLYIYLLLKNRFRCEMIQMNKEVGFANFSLYQDRKDTFWEKTPEYWHESQRLAVVSTLKNGKVSSLELRVQPGKTHRDNIEFVTGEDESVLFCCASNKPSFGSSPRPYMAELIRTEHFEPPFFYVTHFIKRKLKAPNDNLPFGITLPRNIDVREKARRQALELAASLSKSDYLCSRIRGIDAASFEIGCRPETFATEFRFLLEYFPERIEADRLASMRRATPRLGVTYHAGEDFLDISDGLRAIDEAIRFLRIGRGGRIGHALALGVDPCIHYRRKDNHITLSKQDMLDNCVWILKRSCELGVSMDHLLSITIETRAEKLLREIYAKAIDEYKGRITIDDYYNSWKLRGDHPLCYMSMNFGHPYGDILGFQCKETISYKYYNSFIDTQVEDVYRKSEIVCRLLYYYHFDRDVRKLGMQTCSYNVDAEYICLMRCLQDKMQQTISQKGIVIECNLSSNQLIGTFDRYDKHPIFRFNGHLINPDADKYNISVTLNTDDQGVFDTSLENEYALLADSMSKICDENGKRLYSDDIIYGYLEHIRMMGIIHTFPAANSPSCGSMRKYYYNTK